MISSAKGPCPADPATTKLAFRLSARLEHRALAIDLVSTVIAHVPGVDRAFRNEMITAFGEAFNNIVTHGYRGRSDGMLDVEAEFRRETLTLRLKDDGAEVDFGTIQPPDLATLPESGMGVFIMHAMVDEVAYERGALNVLSLTKRMTSSEPVLPRGADLP